jgi:hypothetical protein
MNRSKVIGTANKRSWLFLLVSCVLSIHLSAYGAGSGQNDDDKLVDDAIKSTQDMLKSDSKRQEFIKNNPSAKSANDSVSAVTFGDSGHSQQIYNISADVLPEIMKMVGNDPSKAAALLEKAKSNPEEFLKSLPASVRKQIQDVAGSIENKNKTATKP